MLQDTIACLELAKEYGLKEVSSNIISLLENEYGDAMLDSILQGDLNTLNYLIQINHIIYGSATEHMIRPIHWMMLYVYEKALLSRVRGESQIALYGAGKYGEKFLGFLAVVYKLVMFQRIYYYKSYYNLYVKHKIIS